MPSLEDHIARSVKRTGREYRALHEWLDGHDLGIFERLRRHGILGISKVEPVVREMFGEDGVEEYIEHIREDYMPLLGIPVIGGLVGRIIGIGRLDRHRSI